MLFGQLLKEGFAGFVAAVFVPNIFRHDPREFTVAVHGDDFVGEGEVHQLDYLDGILETAFRAQTYRKDWSL